MSPRRFCDGGPKPPRTASDSIASNASRRYLKARLEEAGVNVPRTHDLVALLQLLLPIEPLWAPFAPVLRRLNDYAVKFRYPGHAATRLDARQALGACRSIRGDVRLRLGLPRK